jgi:hypothetical protein
VVAVAALAAVAGLAMASIEPGSETWFRVMQIKLQACELQVDAGKALEHTSDSASRAYIQQIAVRAGDIHDRCEQLLNDDAPAATQPAPAPK